MDSAFRTEGVELRQVYSTFLIKQQALRRQLQAQETPTVQKPEYLAELHSPGHRLTFGSETNPLRQSNANNIWGDQICTVIHFHQVLGDNKSRVSQTSRALDQSPQGLGFVSHPFPQHDTAANFILAYRAITIFSTSRFHTFDAVEIGKNSPYG
jgi:hypothetical protein